MSSPVIDLDRSQDWQSALSDSLTRMDELLRFVGLSSDQLTAPWGGESDFPLRVTRSYADKIEKGNPQDPLLLQVLPLAAEQSSPAHYNPDPVGDLHATCAPGLIHKYHGRVLLVATGACAIHCRYCFRRAFPYHDHLGSAGFQSAIDYLRAHDEIQEIILSGGDPLVLSDRRLAQMVETLETIPHLRRLRIHSRLPIVLPQRITRSLLTLLSESSLQPVMVIHANHSQELQDDVTDALNSLYEAGIPLFNQSVLLKGVNDHASALIRLSETLFSHRVIPYYLHLLDRVTGASHFEVSPDQAKLLFDQLRQQLPGYLVPRMVREIAGEPYKSLLVS